jgi:hypothetical protein
MSTIQVALFVMVIVEALSVLELYFLQDTPIFNGVAIFSGWEISKEVREVHELVRYLVNWVAGMKLIVVGLLLVLALTAPQQTLLYAGIALAAAVASFFWRMFPAICKLDREGCVNPFGRSRVLGWMVFGLELILIASVGIDLLG